jgi:hypothetical protein
MLPGIRAEPARFYEQNPPPRATPAQLWSRLTTTRAAAPNGPTHPFTPISQVHRSDGVAGSNRPDDRTWRQFRIRPVDVLSHTPYPGARPHSIQE